MKVPLQYFSRLRDLDGPDSIEISEGATVENLIERLYALAPKLRDWDKHLLIASDTDWVDRKHVIQSGECISLMPPVQGG
jgi:molybdopterin converting factor small subunit